MIKELLLMGGAIALITGVSLLNPNTRAQRELSLSAQQAQNLAQVTARNNDALRTLTQATESCFSVTTLPEVGQVFPNYPGACLISNGYIAFTDTQGKVISVNREVQ